MGIALLTALTFPALGGCESTQSKNARAERDARGQIAQEVGLTVSTPSDDVRVVSTTLLSDPDVGSAVAVELENTAKDDQYEVPVLVTVTGVGGDELFTNGTPGLQRSLTHAAIVPAGETTVWVNDQIPVPSGAEAASATVGAAEGAAPTTPVKFSLTQPSLDQDPVSGFVGTGYVKHDGADEQRRVVVSVVGRKGGEIVAVGRGIVARIKPGKRAEYQAFLIGEPQGARLQASVQPNIDAE